MRFDYVKYDERSVLKSGMIKDAFEKLERLVEENILSPREKALILTKLEEAYAWVGKGIRNDQIARNGNAQLLEERGNS